MQKKAAGDYQNAKVNEQGTLYGYETLLDRYANGRNESSGPIIEKEPLSENLGKYVRYDVDGDGTIEVDYQYESILWRVLSDDDEKVELITADTLGTIDFTPTDFDDARNKYNTAIDIMVQKCIELTGISTVRNVNGPSVDTVTETVDFSDFDRTNKYITNLNDINLINFIRKFIEPHFRPNNYKVQYVSLKNLVELSSIKKRFENLTSIDELSDEQKSTIELFLENYPKNE